MPAEADPAHRSRSQGASAGGSRAPGRWMVLLSWLCCADGVAVTASVTAVAAAVPAITTPAQRPGLLDGLGRHDRQQQADSCSRAVVAC